MYQIFEKWIFHLDFKVQNETIFSQKKQKKIKNKVTATGSILFFNWDFPVQNGKKI